MKVKKKKEEKQRRTEDKKIEYDENQKKVRFGLVSLFNGISTFVGYLMPKPFS